MYNYVPVQPLGIFSEHRSDENICDFEGNIYFNLIKINSAI